MKKGFFALGVLVSTLSMGQKTAGPNIPVLTKGQQFTITTTANQDLDMGMGMAMTNNTVTVNTLEVTEANAEQYKLVSKIAKISFKGNMMGKDISYDSDKPGDKDSSELGKTLGAAVGNETVVLINKSSGEVTAEKKAAEPKEDENPMEGLIGSGPTDILVVESLYLESAGNKKAGDKWGDSITTGGTTKINTYQLESVKDNIGTISTTGTIKGTITKEVQGISMDVVMDSKISGTIIVDMKTLLVKKKNISTDVNGNVDVMGQSMTISGKTVTEIVYQ
jgi:hypothetical protein